MRAVKVCFERPVVTEVPWMKEVLVPCPLCGGTTDIDFHGQIICHSCQQEWRLNGEPIIENDRLT